MFLRKAVGPESATSASSTGPPTLRQTLVTNLLSLDNLQKLFEIKEQLGKGSYGTVSLCTEVQTGRTRVLKSVERPEGWDDDRLKAEIQIMANLDHPHVLRIFSYYENSDQASIVMECCQGGELLHTIRMGRRQGLSMEEDWAIVALRQIFEALVYLHSRDIVHKDLKSENILVLRNTTGKNGKIFDNYPHCVICDFGTAEICKGGFFFSKGTRVAGTPAIMAPEVLSGSCGPKSDTWSMGCIMYEIFTNQLPFALSGDIDAAVKYKERWLALHRAGPNWDAMRSSAQSKNLCQQLLAFKANNRITALEALKHPWIRESNKGVLTGNEKKMLNLCIDAWCQLLPCCRVFYLRLAAVAPSLDQYASIFSRLDLDNSGILERSEVIAAMASLGKDKTAAEQCADALDVNSTGQCQYLQFQALCLLSLPELLEEIICVEFEIMAKKRGFLTTSELNTLLAELKPLVPSTDLSFEALDKNRDRKIDCFEFRAFFGHPSMDYSKKPSPGSETNAKSAQPQSQSQVSQGDESVSLSGSLSKPKGCESSATGSTAASVNSCAGSSQKIVVKRKVVRKVKKKTPSIGETSDIEGGSSVADDSSVYEDSQPEDFSRAASSEPSNAAKQDEVEEIDSCRAIIISL